MTAFSFQLTAVSGQPCDLPASGGEGSRQHTDRHERDDPVNRIFEAAMLKV